MGPIGPIAVCVEVPMEVSVRGVRASTLWWSFRLQEPGGAELPGEEGGEAGGEGDAPLPVKKPKKVWAAGLCCTVIVSSTVGA
jgi:hypothetical protein